MSLLMDALKRAELAKQQGRSDDAGSELSMEPDATPAGEPAPTTLPELPKLEDLDEEFMAHNMDNAPPTGTTRRVSRPRAEAAPNVTAERESIRNAFAAKGSVGNDRKTMVILAALGLLVIGGMGIWFWLQFRPTQGLAAPRPAGQELVARQGTIPLPPAVERRADLEAASTTPAPFPAAAPMQEEEYEEYEAPRRTTEPPRPPRAPAAALPEDNTRVRVTTNRPRIDPSVGDAYRLLLDGNLAAAKAAYAAALRTDPRNADALHGMAAIALREGKPDQAAFAYQRILEANPADANALAALVGLNGQIDPVAAESRMKSLQATLGDPPVLHFALGNLYARQQRWHDAQQAYFKAVAADGGNPDYLYNLAVSLDQIHQPKLAAQYYGQALTASDGQPAAFDRAQAARRMGELQP